MCIAILLYNFVNYISEFIAHTAKNKRGEQ